MRRFFRQSARVGDDAETLVEVHDGKYRAGERWSYRARPGDEESVLTILRVESSLNIGVIVHIRIDGLRLESAHAPGGVTETIAHMPFAEGSIDGSVTTLAGAGDPPEDDGGYQDWRREFEAGNAGVFTITVAEAVDAMAQALVN